jgi:hypothetical protein
MEEQAELNQLAAAAGVKDDRIGTAEPEGAYPTMEAALAASAPVHGGMLPASKNLFERPGRHIMVNAAPRMPDFSRPATFDLADGVVIIDGMEFVLPDQLRDELRVKAVEVAREYLMKKLTEALDFMRTTPMTAEVENGGTESRVDEAVQQQPPGSSAEPQV